MFKLFPHTCVRNFCCVKIMCKYWHSMWNVMPHGIWLWIFALHVHTFPHASTCNFCFVELMCKYAYFMWNFGTPGISLWNFSGIHVDHMSHFMTFWEKKGKICPIMWNTCVPMWNIRGSHVGSMWLFRKGSPQCNRTSVKLWHWSSVGYKSDQVCLFVLKS